MRGSLQNHSMDSTPYTKLVSFNCRSFKSSLDDIRGICKQASVVALQEHCLFPHDLPMLNMVDDDFACVGTSAVDPQTFLRGRSHGGVAILYRKSAFQSVSVIECDDVRLVAIKAKLCNRCVIIFSVYMPTDSKDKDKDNLIEFTQCLGKISSILEENTDADAIYMLGDFNAHPTARFGEKLVDFCEDQEWTCADMNMLGLDSDTFTYISDVHGCARWLDHCVVTSAAVPSIKRVWVKLNPVWSDHFPLFVECDLGNTSGKVCSDSATKSPKINKITWGERTEDQIERYYQLCNNKLREIDFPAELSQCCDGMCSNVKHRSLLDNMYAAIVTILSEAASKTFRRSKVKRRGGYIAGWNKYVAPFHREARAKFLEWVEAGKPICGQVYVNMCESRKSFKKQLKWCQNRQDQIRMDILASHHTAKDFKHFWKDTNKMNVRPGLPVSVNDECDHKSIANIFVDHFKVQVPGAKLVENEVVGAGMVSSERSVNLYAKQVRKVIHSMQRGKSPGHDSLSIEHLKYAGVHLPRVLSMFYNLCICHGYLPDELTKTIVVPIIKCKTGDASDKNNYRPISLATVVARVFDGLLYDILMQHVKLHDAQFGFRAGLSTESAILCLKQAVRYYTDRKTPVYACFLDLSKAFDTVLYEKLWGKLRDAGVPVEIISILKRWYCFQRNQVRWAGSLSDAYSMECGVRQGGITSPLLFNLYVNDLIGELSSTHVGCVIDGVCVNNISYADDMVLLGPSVGAIRKLVAICEAYVAEHGLRYNSKKSEVLIFKSGNVKPVHVPPIMLNGVALNVVSSFRYLGHIVNEELKDDADIERERRALAVRGNMIARRFARCSREVKISLFRAYCQSFYSSSLWINHTRRAASVLRVQYNDIFRVLMRLPRFCSASGMFAEARTDDFHAIIRKKVASLRQRARGSRNGILQMIVARMDCPIQNKWMHIVMGDKM